MTEIPRALEPSDAERLATLRASMNHGGAGGLSRAVGPVLDRGLVRAIAGDLLGDDSIDATDSKIDQFTVTDDATSVFQLTFDPLDDSWNVSLSWSLEDGVDYSISGQTLTVLDPTSLFRGIADNGPRTLQVQYDYLTGVPVPPSAGPSIVGNVTYAGAFNATFELPSGILPGDLMVINSRTAGFTGVLLESGWFNIFSDAEPNAHYRVQAKFVDTEEPGDIVSLHGGSDFICSHVMTIIRGTDLADPVVDFASPNTVVTGTASVTTAGVNMILYQVTSADAGPLSVDRGVMMVQGSGAAAGHTGYFWASFEELALGTVTATVAPAVANVFMGIVALRPLP